MWTGRGESWYAPLVSARRRLLALAVAAALAGGCGPRHGPASAAARGGEAGAGGSTAAGAGSAAKSDRAKDPASPEAALEEKLARKPAEAGWAATDADRRAAIAAFAEDYRHYIADAKTTRRAVAGVTALVRAAGALPLPAKGAKPTPGARYWLGARGKDLAVLVVGDAPPSAGLDVVAAPLDAPRLDLKPEPGFRKEGFLMLETHLRGEIDLKMWLSTPLSLFAWVDRPGKAPLDVAIGERPDDPVLVVPDLLPHLARKVQAKIIIDAERMDAVAGMAADVTEDDVKDDAALAKLLAPWGVTGADFAVGEITLVPASAPTYVGVDRALLAAYGQAFAAQGYAAARAVLEAKRPPRSVLVLLLDGAAMGADGDGDTGEFFVRHAVSAALAAFTDDGAPSELDVRRTLAASHALVATNVGGGVNGGLVLNPRFDDADPEMVRELLRALDAAKVPYQFPETGPDGWSYSPSRRLSTTGMKSLDVGLPIADRGAPLEVLSVLDLFTAYRAYAAFYARAPETK